MFLTCLSVHKAGGVGRPLWVSTSPHMQTLPRRGRPRVCTFGQWTIRILLGCWPVFLIFTACKWSCGKAMFLHLYAILSAVGGGVYPSAFWNTHPPGRHPTPLADNPPPPSRHPSWRRQYPWADDPSWADTSPGQSLPLVRHPPWADTHPTPASKQLLSIGSSGRVEGGQETWNLCGRLSRPSFLWLIFTGLGGPWPPRHPPWIRYCFCSGRYASYWNAFFLL